MSSFPPSVIAGAAVAAAIWLATIGLVFASLRSASKRALVFAAIALGVSLLGSSVIKGTLSRTKTVTHAFAGGRAETKKEGWEIDSRWFFAASAALSLVTLVFAAKRNHERPLDELTHYRN